MRGGKTENSFTTMLHNSFKYLMATKLQLLQQLLIQEYRKLFKMFITKSMQTNKHHARI